MANLRRGVLCLGLLAGIVPAAPGMVRADESATLATAINLPSGPGSIEGFGQGYDVSAASGLPGLTYPLELPPGRAGLTPEFAITYAGGRGSDTLGLGWSMELPKLEISSRHGLPAYDGTDALTLSGLGASEELVRLTDGSYREAIEGATPVIVRRAEGGFEATTTAGTTYVFGVRPDSRLAGPDGVYRWNLDAIVDRNGNRVDFAYVQVDGSDRFLLQGAAWNDGDARVVLEYESRPDRVVSRQTGFEVAINHRLATIQTFVGSDLVRTWTLDYANTPEVPSSVLTAIAQVAADGTAMPTWRFEYGAMLGGQEDPIGLTGAPAMDPLAEGRSFVDVDGDGVPDLLDAAAGAWRYRRNRAGEGFADWVELPTSPSVTVDPSSRFADLNGDGIGDLLRQDALGGDVSIYLGGGDEPFGATLPVDLQASFDLSAPNVAMVDVNADGRVDVLASEDSQAYVWLSTFDTPDFEDAITAPPLPEGLRLGDPGVSLADLNGDRLPDLVRVLPEDSRVLYATHEGLGLFGAPEEMAGVPAMAAGERWELRDVNGDGAADLIRVGDQLDLYVNQLDGSFGMTRSLSWPSLDAGERVIFSDVNGNGTVDVLRVDPVSGTWRYWELLGQKPGLLRRFENGLGYSIDFEYVNVASLYEADGGGEGWSVVPPEPMPVIARTVERDGVDWERTLEHTFRNGYYDPAKGEFRGFGEVVERRLGDSWVEEAITTKRYDLGMAEEARKLKPTEQIVAAPDGVISRTTTEYEVVELAGNVVVARPVATDTWHEERGGEAAARRVRSETDYDRWGNVIEQRELGEVDPMTGSDIAGDERITTTEYADPGDSGGPRNLPSEIVITDGAGEIVSATRNHYDGVPREGLPLGQVDARGTLHRSMTWLSGDDWVPSLRQAVDVYGNVIEVSDAEGGTLERTFDDLGRFPVQERTLLDETSSLDALVTRAEWDPRFGTPVSLTGPAGTTTHVRYDGLGRPVLIARPGDSLELPTTVYTYNMDGSDPLPSLVSESRRVSGEAGVERQVDQLDGLGRLRQRFSQDDEGSGAILMEGRLYAADGEVAVTVEGQAADGSLLEPGQLTELLASWPSSVAWRDAAGRTVAAVGPDNRRTQQRYGPFWVESRDHEDLLGEAPYADTPRITHTDGLGRTTRIVDRLPAGDIEHTYWFDAADRIAAYVDPAGNETRYTYDGGNRMLEIDSPDAGVITQVFDDVGRVLERTDARGATIRYEYDVLGRLQREQGIGPDGSVQSQAAYGYDEPFEDDAVADASFAAGKLTHVEDDAGKLDHVYDARGRTVRTTRRFPGADDQSGDGGETVLAYGREYDAQDRITKQIYPDGSTLERRYSARGLEIGVGEFATIAHDALGRVTQIDYANGVTQTSDLDRVGRVLSQRVVNGETTHLDLEHAYDPAGLLGETHDRLGATANSPALDQAFGYDDLRRLVSARAEYGQLQWSYSNDGNLLEQGGQRIRYDGPQPHAATQLGDQVLRYDEAGQLASVEGEGELPEGTWIYDAFGRVDGFEAPDGRRLQHIYDHAGQRAIKRVYGSDGELQEEVLYLGPWAEVRDGKLVRWVTTGATRIAESRTTLPKGGYPNAPLVPVVLLGLVIGEGTRRRWSPRTRALQRIRDRLTAALLGLVAVTSLAMAIVACGGTGSGSRDDNGDLTPNNATRYHIQDRLGSASLVMNGQGQVIARAAHRPYGEKWIDWQAKGTDAPAYRFTDKEEDTLSGAVYIGARHYLPALGRWASVDPLPTWEDPEFALRSPLEANGYGYGQGNPITNVDPTGKGVETAWDIASLAQGVASIANWDENTSTTDKVMDVVGVAMDAAAVVTPFVPGGVGMALDAARAIDRADDAVDAARAADRARDAANASDATRSAESATDAATGAADARQTWTATDDGRVLAPGADVNAVPTSTPNPRDPQWGQVHSSHAHRGDTRAHAHGPETGTGRRVDTPLDESMRRVDDGLKSGDLRLRRSRSDRGGE